VIDFGIGDKKKVSRICSGCGLPIEESKQIKGLPRNKCFVCQSFESYSGHEKPPFSFKIPRFWKSEKDEIK